MTSYELRYARQMVLPEVGVSGQSALASAKVLVVGGGGLGSPCLQYLTAAGVGTLGVIDDDHVDISNLQRQILYRDSDVGKLKVECLKTSLRALNGEVQVKTYAQRLSAENALEICSQYDILVDGTDNFRAKFLLNDVALILNKPLVHASISRFEGVVAVFGKESGICYRCLYPQTPKAFVENCASQGVFGAIPGVVGSVQAVEVLKWILYKKNSREDLKPLFGKMWVADFKTMYFQTLSLSPRKDCLCSGTEIQIQEDRHEESCCCGMERTWQEYLQNSQSSVLLDVRSEVEYKECHAPRARHFTGDYKSLPKDREIYVYCKLGVRSLGVCEELQSLGFKAFSLKGGIAGLFSRRDVKPHEE